MTGTPLLSVVVPAKDEAENLPILIDEVAQALASSGPFEMIVVDDGSEDDTGAVIDRLAETRPWLRRVAHVSACGQSAAITSGVIHARAALVATLDGDGQNDPRYLPSLVERLNAEPDVALVAGQRVARRDTSLKQRASRIANGVRSRVLKDGTRDTGCGIKAFRREVFLRLPYFDGMHRFLPALVMREGLGVRHVDVVDRSRWHGRSKYGIWDRFWIGIVDLAGVWWLRRRRRRVPLAKEVSTRK